MRAWTMGAGAVAFLLAPAWLPPYYLILPCWSGRRPSSWAFAPSPAVVRVVSTLRVGDSVRVLYLADKGTLVAMRESTTGSPGAPPR